MPINDNGIIKGPDGSRHLFEQVAALCQGFSREDIANLAANLMINVVRQQHEKRGDADRMWHDLSTSIRAGLMEHYDALGRRRSVFGIEPGASAPDLLKRG